MVTEFDKLIAFLKSQSIPEKRLPTPQDYALNDWYIAQAKGGRIFDARFQCGVRALDFLRNGHAYYACAMDENDALCFDYFEQTYPSHSTQLHLQHSPLPDAYKGERFDTVILHDALAGYTPSPDALLEYVAALLDPDGTLLVGHTVDTSKSKSFVGFFALVTLLNKHFSIDRLETIDTAILCKASSGQYNKSLPVASYEKYADAILENLVLKQQSIEQDYNIKLKEIIKFSKKAASPSRHGEAEEDNYQVVALTRQLNERNKTYERLLTNYKAMTEAHAVIVDSLAYRLGSAVRNAVLPRPGLRSLRLPLEIFKLFREFSRRNKNLPSEAQEIARKINLADIKADFYRKGQITAPAATVLKKLQPQEISSDQFLKQLHERYLLFTNGYDIPKRQPNPLYTPQARKAMMVLHSCAAYDNNGYSIRSHGVAKALHATEWDICAYTRPGYPWDMKRCPYMNVRRFHRLYDEVDYRIASGADINNMGMKSYMESASRIVMHYAMQEHPSVLHSASSYTIALPVLCAARMLGIPFVYEVRGLWHYSKVAQEPDWIHSDRFALRDNMERLVCMEADHVIAISDELKEHLMGWGVPEDRISLAPNCADPVRMQPRPRNAALMQALNIDEDSLVAGYVGSVTHYENLEDVLQALALLIKEGRNCTFVVVGAGAALQELQRLAASLGIEKHCRFVGQVPHDSIQDYYSLLDIMVLSRRSAVVTELVPSLKSCEAMAMQKTLVASDISPHRNLFRDGTTALLYQQGNVASLADTLRRLIADPELRKTLAENARRFIENERSWTHIGEPITSAYEKALRSNAECQDKVKDVVTIQKVTAAVILDPFSMSCFSGSLKTLPVTPDNWKRVFTANTIDVLIVESAWEGCDKAWHRKIGYYSDEEFSDLKELLAYCNKHGIPTIFWNKEDPVHFERFKTTATLFDHIFTTDLNSVPKYLELPNRRFTTVNALPFAAEHSLHNLLPPQDRPLNDTISFAGTYYGERFPDRKQHADTLLAAALEYGLTIYDRQHLIEDSPYKFPEQYESVIQGGLSYPEMVEAYKAHPVIINCNSVTHSPTMFARRVFEALASGSAVVSSPSTGVQEMFEDSIPVPLTSDHAGSTFSTLTNDPQLRRTMTLAGVRRVMRSHLYLHRFAFMLRAAGFAVAMEELPPYCVVLLNPTETQLQEVANQTIRPYTIYVPHDAPDCRNRADTGIALHRFASLDAIKESALQESWVLIVHKDGLHASYAEDLLHTTRYHDKSILGYYDASPATRKCDGLLSSLQDDFITDACMLPATELRDIPALHKSICSERNNGRVFSLAHCTGAAPHVPGLSLSQKHILVAGSDLKFFKPLVPELKKRDYFLSYDNWKGHNIHDEKRSLTSLYLADVVFCEWGLGNAVWYSHNILPFQKLFIRIHAQELYLDYLHNVDAAKVHRFIFVGPHMRRKAIQKYALPPEKCIVIPNCVDTNALMLPKFGDYTFHIGLVGMTPHLKRIDKALDILEGLLQHDSRYVLHVKGKQPFEYPWMFSDERREERQFYQEQYSRIENNLLLKNSVIFDGWGDDMPEWYRKIGFVLSVSDRESFHLAVAECAAAGGVPIIVPWEGADDIYPSSWITPNIEQAVERILSLQKVEIFRPIAASCQQEAISRFSLMRLANIYSEIL